MARLLFFLQLIVAFVVLPLWPGLDHGYGFLGLIFLGLVLVLPFAAVVAVYGFRVAFRAVGDAWSTTPRSPSLSASAWQWAVRTFPLSGLVAGLVALVGALDRFDAARGWLPQIVTWAVFCLVWGFLGFLLSRILQEVVTTLAQETLRPLLILTPEFSRRFGLTPREFEAAQAVLDGLTYQGAADKLSIGTSTVKSHVLSVYQKTGTGNKIELLRLVEAENARIHPSVNGLSKGSRRS